MYPPYRASTIAKEALEKNLNDYSTVEISIQPDARQLASEVDAVVVVGGKNSANTRHLAEICRAIQARTWHVETEEELEPAWFQGCRLVGISAGASTSDWVVEGVAARLATFR